MKLHHWCGRLGVGVSPLAVTLSKLSGAMFLLRHQGGVNSASTVMSAGTQPLSGTEVLPRAQQPRAQLNRCEAESERSP